MLFFPPPVKDGLQLAGEGIALCKLVIEIHKEGKSSCVKDLEEGIQPWKSVAKKIPSKIFLESRKRSTDGELSPEEVPSKEEAESDDTLTMMNIVKQIHETAEMLQKEVDKLQIEPNQPWESVTKAFNTRIKRAQFRDLEKQLQKHQNHLTFMIITSLPKNFQFLEARLEDGFRETKSIVEAIRQLFANPVESQRQVFQRLGSNLLDRETMLVKSLDFDIWNNRERSISEHEPDTLPWLLGDPPESDGCTPENNARKFLRYDFSKRDGDCASTESIFCIIGKAGSGKSTAMKALCNSSQITDDLIAWADTDHLLVSRFYFSYKGTDLQKSQRGLIRALLYQCLAKQRILIPVTIPQRAELDTPEQLQQYWTLPHLKKAFEDMITHARSVMNLKFCFFIDGLDECSDRANLDSSDGPELGIVAWLMQMARYTHVKFCVSTRPERPFPALLGACPGFKLQERTSHDIRKYAEHHLSSSGERLQPNTKEKLVESIVRKAEGVFLWVVLAVQSLKQGIERCDSQKELFKALDSLPQGLERLYTHILERIEPRYLKEGLRYMLMVRAAGGSMPLSPLAYAAACDVESRDCFEGRGKSDFRGLEDVVRVRIEECCMGLLEVDPPSSSQRAWREVGFLHKSVQDFLETDAVIRMGISPDETWVAEHQLMDGCIDMIGSIKWSSPHKIRHDRWVFGVLPIVRLYLRAARRAMTLGKPARREKHETLYELADDLWQNVDGKSSAEAEEYVHWSTASETRLAPEDARGRERINNAVEFIKFSIVGPVERSQPEGQDHGTSTTTAHGGLDAAKHLKGPLSKDLIIAGAPPSSWGPGTIIVLIDYTFNQSSTKSAATSTFQLRSGEILVRNPF
ncbi:NACHT domain-containing protein [Purpureocillium lilacinum]|uniref:NACHT domain-containing protein n=1 Tax=Purpureocillium lilacinum TaxID=33203 RepID=A0A179H205_PURLI|nr:NACHT domain-containing protein [Purpureocillium lilacinum]